MLNSQKVNSITVLGAGEAGIAFIKEIREKNPDIKLTLIDKNTHYFDKSKFIRSMDLKAYVGLKDFAQERNAMFIQDTVERVNPKQKKIYFKQNDPIDFEVLVVASGVKSKSISLKGERREGLSYLSDINPFEFKSLLKISSELIVYVTTYLGLKLCTLLKSAGKEVRVLGGNWDFLGSNKEKVVNFLAAKQINVHLNVTVDEVIGEGQVKATKISPLKVFSSQMVLLDTGFSPNLDFFEAPINITNMFISESVPPIDGVPQTAAPYEGIFVIGDCGSPDVENDHFYAYNSDEARSQAHLLSEFILEAKETNFIRKALSEEDKQKIIDEFIAVVENVNLENQSVEKN
ncbi:MAG: NAD(P)/FAD-dependent oxidoreductase [Candidatus Omnitrophica bacterium]|jgi:NADH dehydrogenase FAD-containing subunit|nr:NAD(P)/FAD-dependent oxidoreductase [Candidatus Omnitrophota bacterium]